MQLTVLFLAHWLGDFAFQTSAMATAKYKSFKWLSIHTIVYTLTLLAISLLLFPTIEAISYALLNGLLHGITDFFTSKLSHRFQANPRVFYPILGFDQLIHHATLVLSYEGMLVN